MERGRIYVQAGRGMGVGTDGGEGRGRYVQRVATRRLACQCGCVRQQAGREGRRAGAVEPKFRRPGVCVFI